MTRVVCLSVLCCSLYSLCLGAGRGDLPLLKIDTKSPTQDVSLIDIMESNLYVNDMISMCEENVGHRCVHFTECDEEGYWDPNLVTSDMFDVRYPGNYSQENIFRNFLCRFGNRDHQNDICPEENQVCCKTRPGKFSVWLKCYSY